MTMHPGPLPGQPDAATHPDAGNGDGLRRTGDEHLPALASGIARYFDTDYAVAQLAVTLYLFANASVQLFIGPLSDRYGRRRTMLFFMGIALAATILAIVAPTIELFLLARLLQGTAIAGMVIGRAVIRDMVGPATAASMIGYVTMAMTLAPMLGPIAGGFLDEWFGWQATFALLFVFGLLALRAWSGATWAKPITTGPPA